MVFRQADKNITSRRFKCLYLNKNILLKIKIYIEVFKNMLKLVGILLYIYIQLTELNESPAPSRSR